MTKGFSNSFKIKFVNDDTALPITPTSMKRSGSSTTSKVSKPKVKQPFIQSKSFVGVTSRSKNGCDNCRKKKKKCDETYPVCGLCKKRNLECVWRDPAAVKNNKNGFDLNNLMNSQKLIEIEKLKTTSINKKNEKNDNYSSLKKSNDVNTNNPANIVFVSDTKYSNLTSPFKDEGVQFQSIQQHAPQFPELNIEQSWYERPQITSIQNNFGHESTNGIDDLLPYNHNNDDGLPSTISPTELHRCSSSSGSSNCSLSNFDSDLDVLLSNVAHRINSPDFKPDTNIMDSLFNAALSTYQKSTHSNNYSNDNVSASIAEIMTPGFLLNQNSDINLPSPDAGSLTPVERFSPSTAGNQQRQQQFESGHEETDNEDYIPMDESQLIENMYVNEQQLIEVLKSKELMQFLNPAIRSLFKSNDSLKFINPSSQLVRGLDDTGRLFLDHYVSYITNMIIICKKPQENFFKHYLLQLANSDESVLYAIVAWGGMFLLGSESELALDYYKRGLNVVKHRMTNKTNMNNQDYMVLLSAFIALIGSRISTGDTKSWYQLFLQSNDLLRQCGGFLKFAETNKNTNEGKWIVSNFFYHDIMAVRSLNFGTLINMDDYRKVFDTHKLLETDDYGLDPFQGVVHRIFVILGEVVNKRKQLKNLRFKIDLIKTNLNNTETKDVVLNEINSLTNEYNEKTESIFQELDQRILDVKPGEATLKDLKDDPKMLELHLTTFELFQIVFRIYIRIIIKTTEFTNFEIQNLKSQAEVLFDLVLISHLRSILCLPLLLIGLVTQGEEQRASMVSRYEELASTYEAKNIIRSWEVVQLVWKQCDEKVKLGGRCYVDWCDICDDLGWNFCFS